MKRTLFLLTMAVLALGVVMPRACSTTSYGSESGFLAATAPGYYLEDFTGWTYGNILGNLSPTSDWDAPGANGFGWHAYASQGLWSDESSLSTAYEGDALLITFTGKPVTAVAGVFGSTDISGHLIPQHVQIGLSDGTVVYRYRSGFAGFTSDTPFAWLSVDGVEEPESNWAQMDHFFVGEAVPEPSSLFVLIAGLGGLIGGFGVSCRKGQRK